jgi:hypothetical protein
LTGRHFLADPGAPLLLKLIIGAHLVVVVLSILATFFGLAGAVLGW